MMRKNVLRLIALSIVFAPLWCAAAQPSQGPDAYLPESVFEFQPVVEGSEIVHEFILHNRGDAPLSIPNIESG